MRVPDEDGTEEEYLARHLVTFMGAMMFKDFVEEIEHPGFKHWWDKIIKRAEELLGKDEVSATSQAGSEWAALHLEEMDDEALAGYRDPADQKRRCKLVASICRKIIDAGFLSGHQEPLKIEELEALDNCVQVFIEANPRKSSLDRIMEEGCSPPSKPSGPGA